MSQYKDAAIGDIVYFWFAANLITGAAGDGATPLYSVRLAGATASAAPKATGTPTLLTNAGYTDGLHEIALDTTGWAAGEYAVFCTLTISTVNPAGFCGSFTLRAAGSSTYQQIVKVIAGVTLANGAHGGAAATIVLQTPIEANVASETNHDFTALQKTSLNAATPASVQNIPATGSGFTALGDARLAALDATISSRATPGDLPSEPPTVSEITDQVLDEVLAGHIAVGSVGAKLMATTTLGTGPTPKTYTVRDSVTLLPIADVLVEVSLENPKVNTILSGRTNALGQVTFRPDVPAGTTLYMWRDKTGTNFINPDIEVMS